MKTEDFVTYDQAVKLKKLGFNWGCQAYFEDYVDELNRHHRKIRFNAVANDMLHKDFCSAPTLAQARKWIFEKFGLWVEISLVPALDLSPYYFVWSITSKEFGCICNGAKDTGYTRNESGSLRKGIDRALQILTDKTEKK